MNDDVKDEIKPRHITPSALKSQVRSLKRELAKGHRLLKLQEEVSALSMQLQDLNGFLNGKIDRYNPTDYYPQKDPK